jgi:hypothetical protein
MNPIVSSGPESKQVRKKPGENTTYKTRDLVMVDDFPSTSSGLPEAI